MATTNTKELMKNLYDTIDELYTKRTGILDKLEQDLLNILDDELMNSMAIYYAKKYREMTKEIRNLERSLEILERMRGVE